MFEYRKCLICGIRFKCKGNIDSIYCDMQNRKGKVCYCSKCRGDNEHHWNPYFVNNRMLVRCFPFKKKIVAKVVADEL